ncbi:MAG: hypothetical protein ACREKM_13075 [Longimicrobiales bacterium]
MCIVTGSAGAQERADPEAGNWLVGGSLGVPGCGVLPLPGLFTVAFHGTAAVPGQVGPDFFVGTMPRALFEGVVLFGARAGLALPVALSSKLLVLPSAGLSLLGGFDNGTAGGQPGFNAGIAAVVSGSMPTGFRTGVTWHRFRGLYETVWLLEVGFVHRR